MLIGLIREEKIPSDQRVVLTPTQCAQINAAGTHRVVVQSSPDRCFTDEEYFEQQVEVVQDVSGCDVLIGVKEVPIDRLISNKPYFFFSHTTKMQPYNRELLRAILDKHITLYDYEHLTDSSGQRVIAFGRFAGMVGAHNALLTYGSRTGQFALRPMHSYKAYRDAKADYQSIEWPAIRIVLTGAGRVGNGAAEVLRDMNIPEVTPDQFLALEEGDDRTCFVQIDSEHYVHHRDGMDFIKEDFYKDPGPFAINFRAYYEKADIMINGVYWDNRAPAFFTSDEMTQPSFRIQVIADVTCDIAPESSIPSTLRPSTIEEPVYGYKPDTNQEVDPYMPDAIDVMAIDNLPNEMSRDASEAFGGMFIKEVLPFIQDQDAPVMKGAQITTPEGKLADKYSYLMDYVAG